MASPYASIQSKKSLQIGQNTLDLTHKRVKLLQKANELLENVNGCFAFADINCRLCLKLNEEYRYFSTETELFEHIKYI